MLTEKMKNVFIPIEGETLDEYLIRAIRKCEVKELLLEVAIEEEKIVEDKEIRDKLKRVIEILGNKKKRFGIHPDENGREAFWEVVYSRPANYDKPDFLKDFERRRNK